MPSKTQKMFNLAREIAKNGDCKEAERTYRLGAVSIRTDGVIVAASNVSVRNKCPEAHAERRVSKKSNNGSIVYVVRIGANDEFRMSRPCKECITAMKHRGIKKCYYTIDENEFGVISF